MKKIIRTAGQFIGIILIAWGVSDYRLRAQLPTQSLGHLVSPAEYNAIIAAVNAATAASVPSGTIAHFNNTSCPTGWGEFAGARGLYMVGRVAGGTLNTAVGTALTDQENRTHTHSVPGLTVPGLGFSGTTNSVSVPHHHPFSGTTGNENSDSGPFVFGINAPAGSQNHQHPFSGTTDVDDNTAHSHPFSGTTSGSTTSTGTSGTPSVTVAPYLQLLVCQKS